MSEYIPKLSLGPVLYYWSREQLLEFYAEIANSPVDIVYLGETVCAKRRALRLEDWMELGERLQQAGKEVVLSSLALLEADSELKSLRRLCANGRFMVEANDMGAVSLLEGQAFVTGHSINVYNQHSLAALAKAGMCRWVMPLELGYDTLKLLHKARPAGVETEVFAYGRMPLAYSARCFTARAYNLPKDDCQYRCLDFPDGITLKTQEGEAFLAINGIQTQSAQTYDLLPDLPRLIDLGIDVIRISPQSQHTVDIIEAFHACLRDSSTIESQQRRLTQFMPAGPCDGYWHGKAGMVESTQPHA